MKKQILFVDDEQPVLDALRRMVRSYRGEWSLSFADCADTAWRLLSDRQFDTVVSDIDMPGMSGLGLLERIQAAEHTRDIPVVMLTELATREIKRTALDLGAADLLNKPVEPEDLIARLRSVLKLKACHDHLKRHNDLLEHAVRTRTLELLHARLDILWRLGKAAEHRDNNTVNHVIRVGCASRIIAARLGLASEFLETLFLAAPLHDIGKIGIPDTVLLKRGPLTADEWEVMKQHCWIGTRILRENWRAEAAYREWQGSDSAYGAHGPRNPVLEMGAIIALSHHERWDGSGYPRGLRGEQIPLEARIVAIADVFDAVMSPRSYKPTLNETQALEVIHEGAGTAFAPDVLEAFLEALPEIRLMRARFADKVPLTPQAEETLDEANLVCR